MTSPSLDMDWTGPFWALVDEKGVYVPFVTVQQALEAGVMLSDGKDIGIRVFDDAPKDGGESGCCLRKVAT